MSDLVVLAEEHREARRRYNDAIIAERRRIVAALKERRLELGMTQQDVADIAGVSRGQIANAEGGRLGLSFEALIGYTAAVGTRLTLDGQKGTP